MFAKDETNEDECRGHEFEAQGDEFQSKKEIWKGAGRWAKTKELCVCVGGRENIILDQRTESKIFEEPMGASYALGISPATMRQNLPPQCSETVL